MAVRVRNNTARLKAKIENNTAVMIRLMLRDIHSKAEPNTPMKTGNLRAQVSEQALGKTGYIEWHAEYATYQEDGSQGKPWHYTTPGTGPHFAENAVNEVVANLDEYARKSNLI